MARKGRAQQQTTIDESAASEQLPVPDRQDPEETAAVDSSVRANGPALVDGHGGIVEEAPGMDRSADMSPMGDPGDLSAFGTGARLPDDLGVGDDPALDDLTNPGGDLGSTLLDDIAGDLSDPTDGIGDTGGGIPEFDDQSGWAMSGGDEVDENDRILSGTGAEEFTEGADDMTTAAVEAYMEGDDVWGAFLMEAAEAAEEAAAERNAQEALQSGSDPEDDEDESGGGSGAPESETMPAPDDGTGGQPPDEGDFIGGRGDVDPPPETQDHGGGELIGDRGDIDYDPDMEDSGGGALDLVAAGMGAVDPLESESSLLAGDTGTVADLVTEADLGGDVRVDIEMVADTDIGESA